MRDQKGNNASDFPFPNHETSVTGRRLTITVLAILLCISVIIAGIIFRFFWRPIIFAVIMGIAFHPVHEKIKKAVSQPDGSALISTLIVLLMFILLAALVASAASGDIMHAAQYLGGKTGQGATVFSNLLRSTDQFMGWLGKYVNLETTGLRNAIDSVPMKISQLLFATATTLIAGLAAFIGQGVITFFILFFVFRDGHATLIRAAALLPIEHEQVNRLFARMRDSIFANLYGLLAVAFVQGLLTAVAFAMLGIPSPILFGIVAAAVSLVPVVGPALVWLPASVFLFATGHWMKGAFLVAWGIIVVGLSDNIVRPLVIMRGVKLHPLFLLFAIIGGVQQFGFIGLFIGPVVISLILALIEILHDEIGQGKRTPAVLPI